MDEQSGRSETIRLLQIFFFGLSKSSTFHELGSLVIFGFSQHMFFVYSQNIGLLSDSVHALFSTISMNLEAGSKCIPFCIQDLRRTCSS
jgi:hypothetical protein